MNKTIRGLSIPLLALVLLTAAPSAGATVYVRIQPPEVRIEHYDHRQGYVWQAGYWRWRGQHHEWVAGHYARQKNGQHWNDGRWEHHNEQGYYWVGGSWEADHNHNDNRR